MTSYYYQKHREKLWKEARERYQNLSEEETNKREKDQRNISKFYWKRKRKGVIRIFLRKNLVEYRRNYNVAPKILLVLGQSKKDTLIFLIGYFEN